VLTVDEAQAMSEAKRMGNKILSFKT
jgi:hypothetical protein